MHEEEEEMSLGAVDHSLRCALLRLTAWGHQRSRGMQDDAMKEMQENVRQKCSITSLCIPIDAKKRSTRVHL